MNTALKVSLYLIGFFILFINVKAAFIYLIICNIAIYCLDKFYYKTRSTSL
jgi:hypothetical protein